MTPSYGGWVARYPFAHQEPPSGGDGRTAADPSGLSGTDSTLSSLTPTTDHAAEQTGRFPERTHARGHGSEQAHHPFPGGHHRRPAAGGRPRPSRPRAPAPAPPP